MRSIERGYLNRHRATLGNNFDFFVCSSLYALAIRKSFVSSGKKILYSWCVLLFNKGGDSTPLSQTSSKKWFIGKKDHLTAVAYECKLHFDFFWAICDFSIEVQNFLFVILFCIQCKILSALHTPIISTYMYTNTIFYERKMMKIAVHDSAWIKTFLFVAASFPLLSHIL